MSKIFDYDGKVFGVLGKAGDLFIMNILFIITCIPIVTIGAAMTALYGVMKKMVKNEEGYIIGSYFKLFKENFKQSTVMWIICLAAMLLSAVDIYICSLMPSGMVPTFISVFMLMFAALINVWLIYGVTLQSTFDNTLRYTMLNAAIMTFKHLPLSVVMLVIHISPLLAVLFLTKYLHIWLPLILLIWFSLAAYVNSFILNRIYEKYIEEYDDSKKN